MRNKIFKLSLCFLALLIMMTSFAACKKDNDGEKGSSAPEADKTESNTQNTESSEASGDESTEENAKAYKFTVVYGDTNEPAEGIQVQICKGEIFCLFPVSTDKNGVCVYELPNGKDFDVYDVHILNVPEGYEFDNDSVKTDKDSLSYTLTLTKSGSGGWIDDPEISVTPPDVGDPKCEHIYVNDICSKCGFKKLYPHTVKIVYEGDFTDKKGIKHKNGDPIPDVKLAVSDETGKNIVAVGATDAKGIFAFDAPTYSFSDQGAVVGGYAVHITGGVPEGLDKDSVYYFQSKSYVISIGLYAKVTIEGSREPFDPAFIKVNTPIKDTLTAEKKDDAEGKKDTLTCTPADESYYYYAFRPTSINDEGLYRVTVSNVTGASSVTLSRFIGNQGYVHHEPEKTAKGSDPSIEFAIPKVEITDVFGKFTDQNYWLIGVKAEKGAKYPVSFTLKIVKVRDLVPGKDYPIEKTGNIPQPDNKKAEDIIGNVSGKLVSVDINSTLVKDSEGFYHIGSVNGPYAMMTITAPNFLLWNNEDVNFTNINEISGIESLAVTELKVENGLNVLYSYYYHDTLIAYGRLCNKDGAYPVDETLYTFLKMYTEQRVLDSDPNAALKGMTYYK